ncbi:MAG: osmY [Paucimonas sp.]|jgi:osmotically-inducible protein OsmY|nr:osmY [Paucimonas sp.]
MMNTPPTGIPLSLRLLLYLILAWSSAACNKSASGDRVSSVGTSYEDTRTAAAARAAVVPGRHIEGDAAVSPVQSSGDAEAGAAAAGGEVDDATVTRRVKEALRAAPALSGQEIFIHSSNGEVTLTGVVSNPAQIEHAIKLVREVQDVKAIHNQLKVRN